MAPRPSTLPTIFLGHGAAGTAASMQPYVDSLEARGLRARAVSLRRGGRTVPKAERAVPDFQASARPGAIAGGHSYGGRVASLAAVETDYAALILLSYPLHRPGHPETPRTEHWPRIRCPVLLLSGESDPFAQLSLLKKSVKLLPDARLVTFPGVGHGLLPVLDEAMDRAAAFVKETVRAR
ncbi:MAG: alpha/beta hydrolase [Candidatus Dormibacteraeota bacterium]|nr:alpha/beta hydrolase [Candidatus Dormibacteraeota bacterium]